LTEDGWLLSLQHIPYGVNEQHTSSSVTSSKPVVFLLHGFMDESSTWVINSPEESLGFILADAGYDVWLGNRFPIFVSVGFVGVSAGSS